MSLFAFLIVGLIAGWLAGMIMRGGGMGVIGDIVVGGIGAVIGSSSHVLLSMHAEDVTSASASSGESVGFTLRSSARAPVT